MRSEPEQWQVMGMDAALTSTDLAEIAEALEDYGSVNCWAIRVVDAADSFDMDARLPRSRVWVDGDPTSDLVDGTCGIALINGRPVVDLAPYVAVYGRDARLMLIGGTSERCGNDAGELIIRDAYCYWTKVL